MGYATESAQATLDYGFSVLGFEEICAFADLRNDASQRVLTKIGLERGNEFEWEGNAYVWFRKKQHLIAILNHSITQSLNHSTTQPLFDT